MKAMIDFMLALLKLPPGVVLWLMLLGMSNMMVPLFYLGRREAQVMLIATMLSFAIGVILFKAKGMTRILGLMHAPWLVGVYFLLSAIAAVSMNDLFGIWLRVALVLTSVSLVLDIRDVLKYFRGQREPLI